MGLQGVTGGYNGLQEVTRGYRGLPGVTGCYKGLQGERKNFKGVFLCRTTAKTFSKPIFDKQKIWKNLNFLTKIMDYPL